MAIAEALHAVTAREEVGCLHCGLPVSGGAAAGEPAFCCTGCAVAYDVLQAGGLAEYYAQPERRLARVEASGRGFEEFDHETFRTLYVRGVTGGLAETDLYLEGVHCASCLWLVERVPRLVPGLARAELDVRRSVVRLTWDPAAVALSAIARALDRLGYRPHAHRGARAEERRRAEDRAMLAAIGVAGALAINTMLASEPLYTSWLWNVEPEFRDYFRWLCLLLATPALLGPGRVFLRGAWAALATRTLHMDVPIAIALVAGYARGAINTVTGQGPIYLDGVAMLVFLLLIGRYLQGRAQRSASDSAELLHALSPATARVVENGAIREVPAEAVLPGMTIEVRSGETIPADGAVLDGVSELDLSLLSGESRLVRVAAGDPVWSGTINRSAPLVMRVTQAGEATRLGRILHEVERGAARRAPMVRFADRLSGAFVAVILALAALTAWLWWSRDPSAAIDHAIALLIVTCPCALALATPLAVSAAIGRAARAGILIKGGDALEALARPGRMILDKTGTVTEGRTTLVRWDGPDWVKPLVLAVERHATHPVADGFRAAWPGVTVPEARQVRFTPGGGIEAIVDGHHVRVGSPAFLSRDALPAGGVTFTAPEDAALTPVDVAVDGRIIGRAGFGDAIRPGARATLDALRARGWDLRLLSGDDQRVVAAVGDALGFGPDERRGGASPEEKLAAVEAAEREGPVVVVGDGINDAAAIARASVGVGMRGGAEACVSAADVYVARPGIDALLQITTGAARTLGVIRRNIAFSIAYNVAGVALAMTGHINPLIAAILMPVSSLTVVLASWKSRTFNGEPS